MVTCSSGQRAILPIALKQTFHWKKQFTSRNRCSLRPERTESNFCRHWKVIWPLLPDTAFSINFSPLGTGTHLFRAVYFLHEAEISGGTDETNQSFNWIKPFTRADFYSTLVHWRLGCDHFG